MVRAQRAEKKATAPERHEIWCDRALVSRSVLGRFVCAIDSFLSLSGLCRIVCKIKLESPEFKPRKIGWIDNNFVGIIIIFSDNVEGPVWLFPVLLGGIWFDFARWNTEKCPWRIPIAIRDRFWDLRSHQVWAVILENYQSLLLSWQWSLDQ